jgi:hypothetical protein
MGERPRVAGVNALLVLPIEFITLTRVLAAVLSYNRGTMLS